MVDWRSEPRKPGPAQLAFELAMVLGSTGLVFHGALVGGWSMPGLFLVLFFEVFVVLILEVVRELIVRVWGKRVRKLRASVGPALLILTVTTFLAAMMVLIMTEEGQREWSMPEITGTMWVVIGFILFHHGERLIKDFRITGPMETGMPWFLLVFLSLWFGGVANSQGMPGLYIPLFMIAFKAMAQLLVVFRFWIAAGFNRLLFGKRRAPGD